MVNSYKKTALLLIAFYVACSASAQKTEAGFALNKSTGGAPLKLQVVNTSKNAKYYFWNLGDGNTATVFEPSVSYLKAGTYTIRLIAIGADSNDSSFYEKNVIVVPNPLADFTLVSSSKCLTTNYYEFKNASVNASSYFWDFGDGFTDSSPNPRHTYQVPGTYTVRLLARNQYGSSDLKVIENCAQVFPGTALSFSADTTVACFLNHRFSFKSKAIGGLNWQWNFGDSTFSDQREPVHVYTAEGIYTVSLTLTDSNNCQTRNTMPDFISVSSDHAPVIGSSTANGCTPLQVVFTAGAAPAGSWKWDFGDGACSALQNPVHTYDSVGRFSVGLSITGANKCIYKSVLKGLVQTERNTVTAGFYTNVKSGCAPLKAVFQNQSLQAGMWHWEFGDGSTSDAKNPEHIYANPGVYKVQLTAFNADKCSTSIQGRDPIQVYLPKAGFEAERSPGCAPYTVHFKNTSLHAEKWVWYFGDGDSASVENPSHTYLLPGDFTVSLLAMNSGTCADSLTKPGFVHVLNTGSNYNTLPALTGCAPYSVSFSDQTAGAVAWQWKFGDGALSTAKAPAHIFNKPGSYEVSLVLSLAGGCTQVFPKFRTLEVKGASADFSYTQSICSAPYEGVFKDASLNAIAWQWDFGDGNSSKLQNPVHAYAGPGVYSVKLTTRSPEGCENTFVQSNAMVFFDCGPPPGPGDRGGAGSQGGAGGPGLGPVTSVQIGPGIALQLPVLVGCAPLSIGFHPPATGLNAWFWDFGDKQYSLLEFPVHVYSNAGTYDVKLIGKHPNGKADTILFPGYVRTHAPVPAFNAISGASCNDSSISIENKTAGATNYFWDFGDGTNSQLLNPVHSYREGTNNINVSLKVLDGHGCSGVLSKSVFAGSDIPVLSASSYSVCLDEGIFFSCSSSNYLSYLWDFGDGTQSLQKNPEHSYQQGGIFTTRLTTTDDKGCTHQFQLKQDVFVFNPAVTFNATLQQGCNSLTMIFGLEPASKGTTGAQKFSWNFGDGNTSNEQNPVHKYLAGGRYNVVLTAYTSNGCSTQTFQKIDVFPAVLADFSYTQDKNCFPVKTKFANTSTASAKTWKWDFGDGSFSFEKNPLHTFKDLPKSDFVLEVSDSLGCSSKIAKNGLRLFKNKIQVSALTACKDQDLKYSCLAEKAVTWAWDFGDGTLSAMEHPSHAYRDSGHFQVRLVATNAEGCVDTARYNSIYIPALRADFGSPTPMACAPSLVTFQNRATNAFDFEWQFGDGAHSKNPNPSHIYNIPGAYAIKLMVKNAAGCSDSITKPSYIKVLGPVPAFKVSANEACLALDAQFTDLSSGAKNLSWNFGDGYSSEAKNPLHHYAAIGVHQVTLIVADSIGCTSSSTLKEPIRIYPNPALKVVFSDSSGCRPYTPVCRNIAEKDVSYTWKFGDGIFSQEIQPVHTFKNAGIFHPVLTGLTVHGCIDSLALRPVAVHSAVAAFSLTAPRNCFSLPFSFNNASKNASNYFWDFGDGGTSKEKNPLHTYKAPGLYPLKLHVMSPEGCKDSLYKRNAVEAIGQPAYFTSTHNGCEGMELNFKDSLERKSSLWFFGDGTSSAVKNPVHAYAKPGSFSVSLKVEDTSGCLSQFTAPYSIVVNPRPIAGFQSRALVGCTPFEFQGMNTSKDFSSFLWKFSDGDTSRTFNPFHVFTKAGIYSAALIVQNNFGCIDSAVIRNILANQAPIADFKANILEGCAPFQALLLNTGSKLLNPVYEWRYGKGLRSGTKDLSEIFTEPGPQSISLTITNSNGCSATVSKPAYLNVFDLIAPLPSSINAVSVNSNSSIDVYWQASADDDFDHYTLYRLQPGSSAYEPLALLSDQKRTFYRDTMNIDARNSYAYKLLTTDHCGNSFALDALNPHASIQCTAKGKGTGVQVRWSAYQGAVVSRYEIYRVQGTHAPVLVGTVSADIQTLEDTATLCPGQYGYRVKACGLDGKTVHAYSDTAMAGPEKNIFQEQQVTIVKTTVVDNQSILIEWKKPLAAAHLIRGYALYRAKDDTVFSYLETVAALSSGYIDRKTNVSSERYYYKVEALNSCNVKALPGDKSAAILLKGELDPEQKTHLKWSPYIGWEKGVDYYLIEKQVDNGQWIILQKLDASKNEYIEK